MITILIQIDESLEKGMLSYESTKAETACFIDQGQVKEVLTVMREVMRDSEVI